MVTTLNSDKVVPKSQVINLQEFNLPAVWEREIQSIITENVLLYEPFIESAPSYIELRNRLKDRGYTNLPMGFVQLINLLQFGNIPKANVSSINAKKSMLRKRKD